MTDKKTYTVILKYKSGDTISGDTETAAPLRKVRQVFWKALHSAGKDPRRLISISIRENNKGRAYAVYYPQSMTCSGIGNIRNPLSSIAISGLFQKGNQYLENCKGEKVK